MKRKYIANWEIGGLGYPVKGGQTIDLDPDVASELLSSGSVSPLIMSPHSPEALSQDIDMMPGNPFSETPSEVSGTPFPDNFPGLHALSRSGVRTIEEVHVMPDGDVLKIVGIGHATLREIRRATEAYVGL
jgi:hypothetical protein